MLRTAMMAIKAEPEMTKTGNRENREGAIWASPYRADNTFFIASAILAPNSW